MPLPRESEVCHTTELQEMQVSVQPLPLRTNFAWTLVGNGIYAVSQLGIIVFLSKLSNPEMVGQYALALAISTPVFMLTNVDLRAMQVTDARREYAFGHYLALRLVMTTVGFSVIMAIVLLGKYAFETALVILGFGLAMAVESVTDIVHGYSHQSERMDRIAISKILNGTASVLAVGAVLWASTNLVWCALAKILVSTVLLFCYDLPNALWVQDGTANNDQVGRIGQLPKWEWQRLARLLWLSLPIGVCMILISLSINIPRYFIGYHLGERELGFFAAMTILAGATNLVVSALCYSACPLLAKHYAAGMLLQYRGIVLRLLGIAFACSLIPLIFFWLFGAQVLSQLYRPEYVQRLNVLMILLIASGLTSISSVLGVSMTSARNIRIQILIFACVVGLTILGCKILVPRMGLVGAAWAITSSMASQVLILLALVLYTFYKLSRGANYATDTATC